MLQHSGYPLAVMILLEAPSKRVRSKSLTIKIYYLIRLLELTEIVRRPATVQSFKGLVTTGLSKSIRYGSTKVGKWWSSGSSS